MEINQRSILDRRVAITGDALFIEINMWSQSGISLRQVESTADYGKTTAPYKTT